MQMVLFTFLCALLCLHFNHVGVQNSVRLSIFGCILPFVRMSILTFYVWNNEINIELLNILVHSRSKVEVFFWQTLPPLNPQPPPSMNPLFLLLHTNALCAPVGPIHHSASSRRKSTFPGWVFFSSASTAVSVGTREISVMDTPVITGRELWDPVQPQTSPSTLSISTSACSTHLVFSLAPSFVPAVLCTPFLTMMTIAPAWILPCKEALPLETSHATLFQGSGLSGCSETFLT